MKLTSLILLFHLITYTIHAQHVGIGITQPAAPLHLLSTDLGDTARGSIIMSRYWLNATDTRASAIYHRATAGRDQLVLAVSGEGGSYSSPLLYSNAKLVIQADGAVGIGTNTPVNKLSVEGNANFTGNVGIGIANPTARLEVAGSIKATNLILPTGSGAGKVLISDSIGNATWTAPPPGVAGGRLVYTSNLGGYTFTPYNSLDWLGPKATVNVTEGQKIMVTSVSPLGTSSIPAGANQLNLYPGYQCTTCPVNTIQAAGYGILGLAAAQNTLQLYTVHWCYVALPAGTYHFGMIGNTASANWNTGGYGYVTVFVFD